MGRAGQHGQLCTTPDGNGTSYIYDAVGNLTTVTPPAPLGTMTMTYDAAGRVTSVTDGRSVITYTCYDSNDRIIETGPTTCSIPAASAPPTTLPGT